MGSSYSDVPYPEKNYPGPKIDARDPEAAQRAAGDMGVADGARRATAVLNHHGLAEDLLHRRRGRPRG